MTIQLAITEDVSNHILGTEPRMCWHCDNPTLWLELAFEVPLHPGRCSDAKWAEYIRAEQAAGPIDLNDPTGNTA